jgi:formylglycine-generating enzyme required for sulfatase activity
VGYTPSEAPRAPIAMTRAALATSLALLFASSACRDSTPAALPARTSAPPAPSAPPSAALAVASSAPSAPGAPSAAPEPEAAPEGMALVPGGTFTMGADKGGEEDEHPAHPVTLASFWLDVTEVTNEAYERCVAAKVCRPSFRSAADANHCRSKRGFWAPKQPVVAVSWDDARAYCGWVGKRLPREAELERAIRGDDGRRYPWGNEPPTPERTVFGRALETQETDDVGTHPSGRGPYGHDDLAGNVWEWMEDIYDPYAYRRAGASRGEPGTCAEVMAAQDELRAQGRQGFTGSNPIPRECERVLRGGAFNYDGPGLRSSNRVHHPGRFRLIMSGLRCAKDIRYDRGREEPVAPDAPHDRSQ